jgi:hypothetical protein
MPDNVEPGVRRNSPGWSRSRCDLGSVEIWHNYFGSTAQIYGIDIDPIAGRHKDVATKVFIENQLDRDFLQSALQEVDHPAVVIDGGGHTANPQITAFEELDPTLRETWRLRIRPCGVGSLWTGPTKLPAIRVHALYAAEGVDREGGKTSRCSAPIRTSLWRIRSTSFVRRRRPTAFSTA